RLRESVAREDRTPRLSGGRWPGRGRLGAPPPTRRTALYDVLESYKFKVNVVNARPTKTLPGRKTDVLECQWLQKLHTFGLLNNSFRPAEDIQVLRTYLRQRENLVTA